MKIVIKVISILLPVLALWACNGSEGEEPVTIIEGEVSLIADSDQVRSDGVDFITFTVEVTGTDGVRHDVTAHAEIYLESSGSPLSSNVFVTENEGEYIFYAVYGLKVSEEVKVTAIDDVPELPADPQADNLSFRHRMLLIQHTGATCSNCPRMMDCLKKLAQDDAYSGLYHHVASHSYNDGERDAAYSKSARDLSMAYNKSGLYPMLTFNLTTLSAGTDLAEIKAQIDLLKKDKADVGIAAAAKVSGDDVLVNVEMKAAAGNDYRVAVWLLEDDIFCLQDGMTESWHNTHDNALRYAAGAVSQFSFVGEKVGRLNAGDRAGKMFAIPVEDGWNVGNCEALVFVTSADNNGNYDIANCVLCPMDGTVTYDYK